MSVKTKGGYWCEYCNCPIAGIKTTHRTRGTAGILGAPLTAGLSLLATAPDSYHCPTCGNPARRATRHDTAPKYNLTCPKCQTALIGAIGQWVKCPGCRVMVKVAPPALPH